MHEKLTLHNTPKLQQPKEGCRSQQMQGHRVPIDSWFLISNKKINQKHVENSKCVININIIKLAAFHLPETLYSLHITKQSS